MSDSPLHVIIVGAGVAGLGTAFSLLHQCPPTLKIRITLLEASSRLGGRIRTIPIPDDPENGSVNLGASFVHGHENNPVYDILKKHNITMVKASAGTNPPPGHTQIFDLDGKLIPMAESEGFTEKIDKIFEEIYDSLPVVPDCATREDEIRWKQEDQGLETLLEKKVSEKLGASIVDPNNTSYPSQIYRMYKWRISCYNGLEMSKLSSKFANYSNDSRGDHFLVSSYQSFIEIQGQFLKCQPNCEVLFNSPVTSIEKVRSANSRTLLKVTVGELSKAQKSFLADYVVVTASIACLKNELIKFTPELSQLKKDSIKNIGLGPYELVAIGFTEPFWKTEANVDTDWLLFSATAESENYPLALLNFHKYFGKNMLVGHFHGRFAELIANYSDQQLQTMIEKVMQRAFPRSKVSVKWVRRSDWQRTKYVGTGFSVLQVQSSPYDFDRLAEPEKNFDERLLFAGEATYKNDLGCIRAAFLSGQREATRILKQVTNKSRL